MLKVWPHLTLMALMLILFGLFSPPTLWLDQLLTLNDQWWRLFSAHLMHTNMAHLGMNLLAYLILVITFRHEKHQWLVLGLFLILALGISSLLLEFTQAHYLGFSGVLHGLYLFYLIAYIRGYLIFHLVFLAAILIKITLEQQGIALHATETQLLLGTPISYASHLFGSIIGGLLGLVFLGYNSFIQKGV